MCPGAPLSGGSQGSRAQPKDLARRCTFKPGIAAATARSRAGSGENGKSPRRQPVRQQKTAGVARLPAGDGL